MGKNPNRAGKGGGGRPFVPAENPSMKSTGAGPSMPQKFLSIKNFEKYQHYKHRNPPWIKLYNCLLDDYAFSKLPTRVKYLYLGLLILCARHDNRVPNDCTWIARALHMDEKEIDLTPLYRSGLLLASRNHVASILHENALSETEKSRDRVETETEAHTTAAPSALSRLEAFLITPELEAWAAKEGVVNPAAEVEEFKDYWRSVGGKRANGRTVSDWAATFKNRLRDLKKRGQLKGATQDWKEEFLRDETTVPGGIRTAV